MSKERQNYRQMLENIKEKDWSEKNFILFMSMYPEGLKETDITLLCRNNSKWFGCFSNLYASLLNSKKKAPV